MHTFANAYESACGWCGLSLATFRFRQNRQPLALILSGHCQRSQRRVVNLGIGKCGTSITDKSKYVDVVICYHFGSALVWLESLTRKRPNSFSQCLRVFFISTNPTPTTFPDMPDGVLSRLRPFLKTVSCDCRASCPAVSTFYQRKDIISCLDAMVHLKNDFLRLDAKLITPCC